MTKYECARCSNRYEGEVDCPKCGCGVATSVFPDTLVITEGKQDLYAGTAAQILTAAAPDPAVITSLNSAPVRKLAERIAIAVAGDEQLGGGCDLSAGMFGTRLSALVVELAAQEAELYAAQDQVAGLQELMALPKAPPLCPHCGTHEVSQERTCHNSSCTSYAEPETIWEGWKEVQDCVATDIVAEAQVIEDARVTQLLATLKRADGIISMLMPGAAKVFNLDIMELNEGMMEIAQALAVKKGAAPCPSN